MVEKITESLYDLSLDGTKSSIGNHLVQEINPKSFEE
jgi:hypothetical protein